MLTTRIYACNIMHKSYFSKGKIYATLPWPSEIAPLKENFFSQTDGEDYPYQPLGGHTGTTPAAAFWSSQLGAQRQTTEKNRKGQDQPDIMSNYLDSPGLLFSIRCDL